jgi:hypothetical protein
MKRIIGHLKVHGGQGRAVGRDNTIGSQEAESLYIGRSIGEIVHSLVETSVCGRLLDKRTCEIKIIQDFESARVPKKDTKARVSNDTSIACHSGTHVDTATEGAEFGQIGEFAAAQLMGTGHSGAMWNKKKLCRRTK